MTRPPSWELAAETVAEARRFGGVPSLERLGELGQLGGLSALIAALDDDETLAGAAIVHAREREGLGLAAGEIVAELLALGRVLDPSRAARGARGGRLVLDAPLRARHVRAGRAGTARSAHRAS